MAGTGGLLCISRCYEYPTTHCTPSSSTSFFIFHVCVCVCVCVRACVHACLRCLLLQCHSYSTLNNHIDISFHICMLQCIYLQYEPAYQQVRGYPLGTGNTFSSICKVHIVACIVQFSPVLYVKSLGPEFVCRFFLIRDWRNLIYYLILCIIRTCITWTQPVPAWAKMCAALDSMFNISH